MKQIKRDLHEHSDRAKAKVLRGFFKTGKGQYGEGDVFLGISVPVQREIAKSATGRVSFDEVSVLLNSKIHEERLVGLLILIERYKEEPKRVYDFYLENIKGINNWDLVDLSASKIVGDYLLGKQDRKVLLKLARSGNLWERRIAVVSCYAFIREVQFEDVLRISEMLLDDKHDLIHKAVGWMLREVGKKDKKVLERFLKKNYSRLPRTTLRYAIERFGEGERKGWLKRGGKGENR